MTVLPTLASASAAAAARAVAAPRAVGKANSSRTLDGECAGDDTLPFAARTAERRRASCQIGTAEIAPLWNGPRLRPAFVAQVLGQVMMDAQARALELAPAAYRERGAQIARLLDDRL